MVESLETRSAPALAAINAFVRGSSARLCSSNKLGWDGVCLEHHRAFPGERNDSVSTHHLVVLFTSHVSRGEASAEHARFVPYSFSPGDIKLFSEGPIGACKTFTDNTMILCALDPRLVAEVGDDLGAPSTVEFRPIANLRDDSLQGIEHHRPGHRCLTGCPNQTRGARPNNLTVPCEPTHKTTWRFPLWI